MLADNICSQQAASELKGDSHEAPCSINELPPAILVSLDSFCCCKAISLNSVCQYTTEAFPFNTYDGHSLPCAAGVHSGQL